MSKLLFKADKSGTFDGEISAIGSNQININFHCAAPIDSIVYSGFYIVNEHNGIIEADYSDYIYKYRDPVGEYSYFLSNDRSEYIPPVEVPKGETVFNIEDNSSVEEDSSYDREQINNILDLKITELSNDCRDIIESGVDIVFDDGIINHFSYSLEKGDQNNIDDLLTSVLQTGLGQYYHADGKTQEYFEPYKIFKICSMLKLNKLNTIARYNQLTLMLRDKFSEDKEYTSDDVEYIDQVGFRTTKLKGQFQKAYVANRTQNEDQMEAIKQKLIAIGVEFPPEEKEADNATK